MINNKKIIENLEWLEEKFQECSGSKKAEFGRNIILYGRCSVLEVCGWLEMAVDDMLCDIYKEKVGEDMSTAKKDLYINNTWGLSGEAFEKICSNIVGYATIKKKMQKSEIKGEYDFLVTFISDIFKKRNEFAHTYAENNNEAIYKAPGILISDVRRVHKILVKIKKELSE